MKIPEKLKNLTMLDLARGPWLFILSVCGVLTGHMISALLPLRTEDPFKFSLIDTWPHVTGIGIMSLVFYSNMAKKAKDISDFRRMRDQLRSKVFSCFRSTCNSCSVHYCSSENSNQRITRWSLAEIGCVFLGSCNCSGNREVQILQVDCCL